jgi:hypothetical protein
MLLMCLVISTLEFDIAIRGDVKQLIILGFPSQPNTMVIRKVIIPVVVSKRSLEFYKVHSE